MVTVTIYGDWEFRCLQNGVVQSKNDKLGLGWQERNADQIGFIPDQIYVIGLAINQIASVLPTNGRQELPVGSAPPVPATRSGLEVL